MAKSVGKDIILKMLTDVGVLQTDVIDLKLFLSQLEERSGSRFLEVEKLILEGFHSTSEGLFQLDRQLSPITLALSALAENALSHRGRLDDHERRLTALERKVRL